MNQLFLFHPLLQVSCTLAGCTIHDIIVPVGFMVELVILRGLAQSSDHSGAMYDWASGVVAQACYDRRNVRVCVSATFF